MSVPTQSPALGPQNLLPASQSNISCHVPPLARPRIDTSSLGEALTCEDRDGLSSGSNPSESFIQWQKVERGNRVQPILQTLNDCTHQQRTCPDSGLRLPGHSYCQSAVSPPGTWRHLSLPVPSPLHCSVQPPGLSIEHPCIPHVAVMLFSGRLTSEMLRSSKEMLAPGLPAWLLLLISTYKLSCDPLSQSF